MKGRTLGLGLCLVAGFALLTSAPAVRAEESAWDQARATELAQKLASLTGQLRLEVSRDYQQMGAMERRRFELAETLRLIRNGSRHLANQLVQGNGRDETRPTARRLGVWIRDARTTARGMVFTERMQPTIDQANEVIAELATLYGADPSDVAAPPK